MNIREFQEYLVDRLNKVEALLQGGCKPFAEDTRSVYDESSQFIREGGVAVVVVTPDLQRNGCAADGIPMDTKLLVRCMELPPVAGSDPNTIRGLSARPLLRLMILGNKLTRLGKRDFAFDISPRRLDKVLRRRQPVDLLQTNGRLPGIRLFTHTRLLCPQILTPLIFAHAVLQ